MPFTRPCQQNSGGGSRGRVRLPTAPPVLCQPTRRVSRSASIICNRCRRPGPVPVARPGRQQVASRSHRHVRQRLVLQPATPDACLESRGSASRRRRLRSERTKADLPEGSDSKTRCLDLPASASSCCEAGGRRWPTPSFPRTFQNGRSREPTLDFENGKGPGSRAFEIGAPRFELRTSSPPA